MKIDDFLTRLDGVKQTADGWAAKCPAHEDNKPSLSVTVKGGKILVNCHAGCPTDSVLAALNLKMSDLFQDDQKTARTNVPRRKVAEYIYCDENGTELYRVIRFDPKDFRQCHKDANGKTVWNMRGVRLVPYHLDELVRTVAQGHGDVFITEGEKDADALRQLGITATSNTGGAGKWRDEYADYFKGVQGKVTIIADRDPKEKNYPGQRHAFAVRDSLLKVGVKAAVVYVPKGKDAADYIQSGATADDFFALADGESITPPWETEPPTDSTADDPKVLTNYTEAVEKKRTVYYARTQREIRADLYKATGNWPRKVGGCVFVFQPGKSDSDQRYLTIRKAPALFSWIRETLTPRWKSCNGGAQDATGCNYVTMDQLFESIRADAITYQGISRAPHWPPRRDQFYDYGELPQASEGHRVFWQMIDFFCLANDTYTTLTAALFVAPMYYVVSRDETPGATPKPLPRPLWIIDTVDGQGSGKSTIAKKVALLYGANILDVTMSQMEKDPDKVLKRILSTEGRSKRVFLIDNITGTISNATLAAWVTAETLSGLAPYGRGEETRTNDFTWIGTVNGAAIDTDTASRAYTIKVKKRDGEYTDENGKPQPWEPTVDAFIYAHRLQLYADILDMLDHAKPRQSDSRFPDFDARVLSAVCRTDADFDACRASIEADATGANVDAELMDNFTEAVENYLTNLSNVEDSGYTPTIPVMMSHAVITEIKTRAGGKLAEKSIKQIRDLLKTGLASRFSHRFKRLGDSHPWRKEAIVYGLHLIPDGATETEYQTLDLVTYNGNGTRPDIQHPSVTVKVATIR